VGGIAAGVLAVAIGWVLLVPAADRLAHHDVGSAKPAVIQKARDAARGRLLTLAAGFVAVGALVYTARTFTLSRRSYNLTEQGQVTDRYTKAIEQLDSTKARDVRIGGIYALERIARDSERDHPTVMEVLSAFVREHSHDQWPEPPAGAPADADPPARETRPDVQAAMTAIGRLNPAHDHQPVNLASAILTGADLTGITLDHAKLTRATLDRAKLTRADLTGADLDYARLADANLTNAHLEYATLTDAVLTDAKFIQAHLTEAILTNAVLTSANLLYATLSPAYLHDADLTRATLDGAHLKGAKLTDAVLTHAHLEDAKLTGAVLTGANLTDAKFIQADLVKADLTGAVLTDADFTGADLTDALWPRDAVVPQEWERDIDSGRLRRVNAEST
jgi:uncharacterized protein YjbI with pentapeptide repeats